MSSLGSWNLEKVLWLDEAIFTVQTTVTKVRWGITIARTPACHSTQTGQSSTLAMSWFGYFWVPWHRQVSGVTQKSHTESGEIPGAPCWPPWGLLWLMPEEGIPAQWYISSQVQVSVWLVALCWCGLREGLVKEQSQSKFHQETVGFDESLPSGPQHFKCTEA